ncbi:hypothetical protein ASG01_13370 [Chryseobacterium sp. Leaf180]|uniref:hypothetical protein n=1 Tax=Chryseobacterium sp. Leaf180 TaxID=1736289 RepID=UPI0006F28550|nr:hypothetical protein [Chryseobacterium sp. Leaf180]KQR91984.1 hypothetical protein ASG01_13370 [Chryseobacterium sp. Leaf180]
MKFNAMIVNIELENAEDFAFIKQLLEKIKGVKSVSVQENSSDLIEGVPPHVYEAIERYADSVKEEDLISSEEFFANARKKICELYSRK